MNTVLFDIDGTILLSGGAGGRALGAAMHEQFGIQKTKPVDVHGRTDRGIVFELLRNNGIQPSESNWWGLYEAYLQQLPAAITNGRSHLLPGVEELLDAMWQRADFSTGLLTGNSRQAADMKLAPFGLDSKFEFGGFGAYFENRDDVAARAKGAAQNHLGSRFHETKVWVIGDTIHDITCGQSISARTIAVLTGGTKRETLELHSPDHIFDDLSDTQRVIELIYEGSEISVRGKD